MLARVLDVSHITDQISCISCYGTAQAHPNTGSRIREQEVASDVTELHRHTKSENIVRAFNLLHFTSKKETERNWHTIFQEPPHETLFFFLLLLLLLLLSLTLSLCSLCTVPVLTLCSPCAHSVLSLCSLCY